MARFSTQLWVGWWLHVFVHLSVLPVLGFWYRHVRRVWGRMSMVKAVSLMRIGDMNWWLTPTPSNNLMKCNPKYPSVKQLWIMQVCLSYENLHFVMYIISPEINSLTNYPIGECTLNNIASFLPMTKSMQNCPASKVLGKI